MEEVAELLRTGLFAGLGEAQLQRLGACGQVRRYRPGEALIAEGATADGFFLILEGEVGVSVHQPHRGSLPVESLGAGDLLGWSWLTPPHIWQLDASANGEVRAVAFDASCIRQQMARDHELGYQLLRRFVDVISHRLQASRLQRLDVYAPPSAGESP